MRLRWVVKQQGIYTDEKNSKCEICSKGFPTMLSSVYHCWYKFDFIAASCYGKIYKMIFSAKSELVKHQYTNIRCCWCELYGSLWLFSLPELNFLFEVLVKHKKITSRHTWVMTCQLFQPPVSIWLSITWKRIGLRVSLVSNSPEMKSKDACQSEMFSEGEALHCKSLIIVTVWSTNHKWRISNQTRW
jgi:hypothetical protein